MSGSFRHFSNDLAFPYFHSSKDLKVSALTPGADILPSSLHGSADVASNWNPERAQRQDASIETPSKTLAYDGSTMATRG